MVFLCVGSCFGWFPPDDKSMMANRLCPNTILFPHQKSDASGPRWLIFESIRSTISLLTTFSEDIIPHIPHIYTNRSRRDLRAACRRGTARARRRSRLSRRRPPAREHLRAHRGGRCLMETAFSTKARADAPYAGGSRS